jgi:hypothetical protein
MRHFYAIGEFADREIYDCFSCPSGYSVKTGQNAFPGKRSGNRAAFTLALALALTPPWLLFPSPLAAISSRKKCHAPNRFSSRRTFSLRSPHRASGGASLANNVRIVSQFARGSLFEIL